MINLSNVSKYFGTQDVLHEIDIQINEYEKIGIVGPNGQGKSTFFNLISGEIKPNEGYINIPKKITMSYMHQNVQLSYKKESLLEYTENSNPKLIKIKNEIKNLNEQIQKHSQNVQLLNKLDDLLENYALLDGYEMTHKAETALSGLGFKENQYNDLFENFSGGWKMRAELARLLISNPKILLLDEPSNYLDLPAIEWLKKYLENFNGTMLMISHDRYLLNSLTTKTIEISNGNAIKYEGNYEYYIDEKNKRLEHELNKEKNLSKKREEIQNFIDKFRANSKKASLVQSRIKMLDKMEEVDVKINKASTNIRIPTPPSSGKNVISITKGSFGYNEKEIILNNVDLNIDRNEKFAFIGANGAGKTTLLKILAGNLKLKSGNLKIGHNVIIGYQSQEFGETLNPDLSVFEMLLKDNDMNDNDARKILGDFGFSKDSINKKTNVLSGGEKIRLSFARMFSNPPNYLILDEPTTHLDIDGRAGLEKLLKDYEGTICVVSHDITFIRNLNAHIIHVNNNEIDRYYGNYDYFLNKSNDQLKNTHPETKTKKINMKKEQRKTKAESRLIKQKKAMELKSLEKNLDELHRHQKILIDKTKKSDANFMNINKDLNNIVKKIKLIESEWEKISQITDPQ
ncbi:MAG: ABC-F family ATP-binding cassette domain-containing protein [SAR202 cluster bacterium]|nr:ABC-F family ATP-binding cassette domain-containing protein [SAR202 cluster bacterium]